MGGDKRWLTKKSWRRFNGFIIAIRGLRNPMEGFMNIVFGMAITGKASREMGFFTRKPPRERGFILARSFRSVLNI
jgi:hypothetical protein